MLAAHQAASSEHRSWRKDRDARSRRQEVDPGDVLLQGDDVDSLEIPHLTVPRGPGLLHVLAARNEWVPKVDVPAPLRQFFAPAEGSDASEPESACARSAAPCASPWHASVGRSGATLSTDWGRLLGLPRRPRAGHRGHDPPGQSPDPVSGASLRVLRPEPVLRRRSPVAGRRAAPVPLPRRRGRRLGGRPAEAVRRVTERRAAISFPHRCNCSKFVRAPSSADIGQSDCWSRPTTPSDSFPLFPLSFVRSDWPGLDTRPADTQHVYSVSVTAISGSRRSFRLSRRPRIGSHSRRYQGAYSR